MRELRSCDYIRKRMRISKKDAFTCSQIWAVY